VDCEKKTSHIRVINEKEIIKLFESFDKPVCFKSEFSANYYSYIKMKISFLQT